MKQEETERILEILLKIENLLDKVEIIDANIVSSQKELRAIKDFFQSKRKEMEFLEKKQF
jgi:hypothetical protein